MTEEEAKTKWCPFARIWSITESGDGNGSWNRHPHIPGISNEVPIGANCIGSACMAWRHLEEHRVPSQGINTKPGPDYEFDYGAHGTGSWVRRSAGYCGLAGSIPAAMKPTEGMEAKHGRT